MTAITESTATAQKIAESMSLLPPLPETAQQILTCFGDEFIDVNAVADVVESDPGICARLLGLSNSSYFGLAEPVNNVREAISRVLGVDTVRSLVLAMAIQRSFNSKRCPAFDAERFWMQSLQTAECCKRIAAADESADGAVRDLAYSTGLCHNLGLLALAHMEPDLTNSVLRTHGEQAATDNLRQLFFKTLNTDHRIMTSELSRIWGLPAPLVSAYRYRAFLPSTPDGRLDLIVAVGAAAVGNSGIEEDRWVDLSDWADDIGLTDAELQQMAFFGDRQADRIRSLSCNMST